METEPLKEAKRGEDATRVLSSAGGDTVKARHLLSLELYLRRNPLPGPSLPGPDQLDHLDLLALDFHGLLPEVHTDSGLSLVWESTPAEAESQAGLAHVGVPNHDDFEDTNLYILVHR